ncbi:protein CPR-5 [Nymphaea colorata]|nr:protein CPR-5 [Nymphaea colorata]XP_031492114.1 protein CPR-5 [Nymphaea colorata]XP_031492116.1 protein CPR-5 [Nymphaea colorata]
MMAASSINGDDGWLIQQTSESPTGIQASSSIPSYIDVEVSSCTTRSQANGRSSLESVSFEGFKKRPLRSPYPSISGMEDDGVNRIKRVSKSGGLSLRRHRIRGSARRSSSTLLEVSGCRRGSAEVKAAFEPSFREDSSAVEALGLPLGMSMAVVFSKVLDGANATGQRISADHLSRLCSSAIKESIFYVFGNHFNAFIGNFERSFGSTLQTLRSVNHTSLDQQKMACTSSSMEDCVLDALPPIVADNSCCLADETLRNTSRCNNQPGNPSEEVQEHSCTIAHGYSSLPRLVQKNSASTAQASSTVSEESQEDGQVVIHGQVNQQVACIPPDMTDLRFRQSFLGTFERSVREQVRSNDLKTYEIGLTMKQLQLKESKLIVDSDANFLERLKLSFGFSKASFKKEKLENEMKNAAYSELMKNCADCLLGGLLIMSAFICYAAYVHSYDIFIEASASCTQSSKGWRNWWIPKPISSLGSPLFQLICYAGVLGRMLFSLCFFALVAYLLLRQSCSSGQAWRITFIIIMLGVFGSISGKLCVDGLGGSGNCWLCYWCILCLLHAVANFFTPALHYALNGPVAISQSAEKVWFPYWLRRSIFYSCIFMILPMLCGLMPFASISDWGQHFLTDGISR